MKSILCLLVSGHLEAPYYEIRHAENESPVTGLLVGSLSFKTWLDF